MGRRHLQTLFEYNKRFLDILRQTGTTVEPDTIRQYFNGEFELLLPF